MKSISANYPIFSETVQLLLLWCARHYFSGYLTIEMIECLVAAALIYSSSHSHNNNNNNNNQDSSLLLLLPMTSTRAYYMVLSFLSTFDWENDVLIVDYSLLLTHDRTTTVPPTTNSTTTNSTSTVYTASISSEDRILIYSKFRASKTTATNHFTDIDLQQRIHPVMNIVTSIDKLNEYESYFTYQSHTIQKQLYTQNIMEKVILSMIIHAAQTTVKYYDEYYFQPVHRPTQSSSSNSSNSSNMTAATVLSTTTPTTPTPSVLPMIPKDCFLDSFRSHYTILRKCNVILEFPEQLLAPQSIPLIRRKNEGKTAEKLVEEDELLLYSREYQEGPLVASSMIFANTNMDELQINRLVVV
jgi:hypothetical protein